MPIRWRERGIFLLLAAILLAAPLLLGREAAEKPEAEKAFAGEPRAEEPVSVTAPEVSAQKNAQKNACVRPAYTRIIAEIDGMETDLGAVLLPELLLDSPDARLFNERVERLYQELVRYYQMVKEPDITWAYETESTGTEMTISLWETRMRGEGQNCSYTVDLATGKIPYLEDTWGNFRLENHAPELVSTRYEGFLEPSWYGSLVLPEILLNSPDAEAVNQEIEGMYWDKLEDEYPSVKSDAPAAAAQETWDPWWDNVWYTAYQSDDILSVGITCNNIFGCRNDMLPL